MQRNGMKLVKKQTLNFMDRPLENYFRTHLMIQKVQKVGFDLSSIS